MMQDNTAPDWTNVPLDGGGQRELRRALGCFATGIAVITTRTCDGRIEGLTANSFSSVSLDPPLVLWSLQSRAPSLDGFTNSGWFAVNVLTASQHHLSRHFATPAVDKFAGLDWTPGLGGCPVLAGTLARFECSVHGTMAAGDHVIFIGRVGRVGFRDGVPLLYSAGSYGVPVPLATTAA